MAYKPPKPAAPRNPLQQFNLVITHEFAAPRDRVFKAWIEPAQMAKWWGPNGFTNPVCELDAKAGGAIFIEMTGPDGKSYPMSGMFREVIEPELLVFSAIPAMEAGRPVAEVLDTVMFEEAAGNTKMTLRAEVVSANATGMKMLQGQKQGWIESLERLDALLAQASE